MSEFSTLRFRRPRIRKRTALAVTVLALQLGCSVPDLKPFSDATAEMATQIRSAFDRTQSAIAMAAATATDENSEFAAKGKQLKTDWGATRNAIAALVDYADSLASVAEAGKKGQATVGRLTTAVSNLSGAVGVLPFAGAAGQTAKQIIDQVAGKIIEMKAEKDIRKAVHQATEAVDMMAPLLKQNLADLARIHEAASNAWEGHVQGKGANVTNYYEALAVDERRIRALLTLILNYQSAADQIHLRAAEARAKGETEFASKLEASLTKVQQDNLKALRDSDLKLAEMDLTDGTAAKVEVRQRELKELLEVRRKEMAGQEPKYQVAMAEQDKVREDRELGARLLSKSQDALAAWRKAHLSLEATAGGEQSRLSLAGLGSILSELSALAKK